MLLVSSEARSECAPISHLALPRPLPPIKSLTGNEKKWRRGRDCSRLRRESSASLRTDAARPRRPKIAPRFLSNPGGFVHTPAPPKIEKGLRAGPFLFLAERVGFEPTDGAL